jgi:ADP-ribosylglycohydrolase
MDAGRARDSLNGLALGDAFGETWFRISAGEAERRQLTRDVPAGQWPWTDDTAMALSLYQVLTTQGEVRQDDLARAFADAYAADPYRGYGGSMHDVLRCIGAGEDWRAVTTRQFGGMGSWGNGAAMRVAPLGAWLAVDLASRSRSACPTASPSVIVSPRLHHVNPIHLNSPSAIRTPVTTAATLRTALNSVW